jgi:hypothetical protein
MAVAKTQMHRHGLELRPRTEVVAVKELHILFDGLRGGREGGEPKRGPTLAEKAALLPYRIQFQDVEDGFAVVVPV